MIHLGRLAPLVAALLLTSVPLLVHELGHALPAMAFGLPWRIRIGLLGPYCAVRGRYIWYENAAVAIGGPVASILAAVGLWHWWPGIALTVGLIGAANA